MKRSLYIGDVHGCADELERIIDSFGFVRGSDTLYQTGDIINKGPDMLRSVQIVQKLGILTVRGNHEEHLIRMMSVPQNMWTEKQRKRFQALSIEDWEYIYNIVKTWPLWRDTPHALLVHAGLEPGKNHIEEMNKEVLLSIRLWNNKPWFEQVKWDKLVIFGHWAKMGFVNIPGFIGLDSGCCYGKSLSAYCPEESRFYEIRAARKYTPVKDKAKESESSPCKVLGDNNPCEIISNSFDELKEKIITGDIKNQRDSFEKEIIRKASPSISAEWAGYT